MYGNKTEFNLTLIEIIKNIFCIHSNENIEDSK